MIDPTVCLPVEATVRRAIPLSLHPTRSLASYAALPEEGGAMDDAKKAVAMWSMGFGDRNEALSGSAVKPARPRQRALKSDWKTRRMPRAHAKID